MTIPTPEGVTAIQAVAEKLEPSDLIGCNVVVATKSGFAYHGTLSAVSPEGTLTIDIYNEHRWAKFHVAADDLKSCKQHHFDTRKRS